MLNLSKVKLPDCIETGGKLYFIKTDFRTWLCFSQTVNTKNAVIDDVDFVYKEVVPDAENKAEAFKKLFEFYMPKNELPRRSGGESDGGKILDYFIDADYIYAAFYEQYKIDLLATDRNGHVIEMHWHKFLALLSGLHNTKLNEIMSWRGWHGDINTDYGKHMMKLQKAWEFPDQTTDEIQKDLNSFNSLFEKN